MTRDLPALAGAEHDVLVVGGGIYGLMAAYDATLRGLRVALVERGDLGGATSFNHLKTLHGGLRYLQAADLGRARESVRERRAFARAAPDLVDLVPFVLPTGRLPYARWLLRCGFALDAVVAADRNRGVADRLRVPRGRVVSRADLARLMPDPPPTATGGAVWYDYVTTDGERLTMAVALASARHGACLANHVDAIEPIRAGNRVTGMVVRDRLTGDLLPVRARVTLNAAGAGAPRVMASFGVRRPVPLVKAMNVVTRHPAWPAAVGARSSRGRLLFAVPWRGRLAIGTWQGDEPCGADATVVGEHELDGFLAEIRSAFPALALTRAELTLVHRGVVPARLRGSAVTLAERPIIRDHRRDGIEGAVSLVGVKYTTARAAAARAVDLAAGALGVEARSRTADVPLMEADRSTAGPVPACVDAEAAGSVLRRYDPRGASRIFEACREAPHLAERLSPAQPIISAELLEAVRHEMAITLEDAVVRRLGLGAAGYPGAAAARAAAGVLQAELAWSAARVTDELAALRDFYQPLPITAP